MFGSSGSQRVLCSPSDMDESPSLSVRALLDVFALILGFESPSLSVRAPLDDFEQVLRFDEPKGEDRSSMSEFMSGAFSIYQNTLLHN